MEIIKTGNLPSEKLYKANCRHCGCVFQFQAREATIEYNMHDGDHLNITCPTTGCGTVVIVAVQH